MWECEACGACCEGPWVKILLPEFYENGKCKHLKDSKCSIYENRPDKCRVVIDSDGAELIQKMSCDFVRQYKEAKDEVA